MRSKTSFFNFTLFRKNILRFWPLWTVYLLGWLLVLPYPIVNERGYRDALQMTWSVLNMGQDMGILSGALMGVFSAMAVWSFLYNPRSAQGVACLPLRRENLYLSTVLSGLVPVLAANVLIAAAIALAGAARGVSLAAAAVRWFGIVSLLYFFFYAFATLCAMLTGHLLILPVVYVILNFVAVAVQFLLRSVFSQFVYGMSADYVSDWVSFLSPPAIFSENLGIELIYPPDEAASGYWDYAGARCVFHGWGTLAVYACVGLLLLLGALLLFRRRNIETAGDVVALKPLKPVFRWCMALGCGLSFGCVMEYLLGYSSNYTYQENAFVTLFLYSLLGSFIGWFGAEMLLKKTFRVFVPRTLLGFLLCCCIVSGLMLGMRYDLFGYERRVPDPAAVESVRISSSGEEARLTEPESILMATELHRSIIADKEWNWSGDLLDYYIGCTLRYSLKNGGTLTRRYPLRYDYSAPMERSQMAQLQAVMNTPDAIAARKATAFAITRDNIYAANVFVTLTAQECAEAAGYDSPEEFIHLYLMATDPGEYRRMSPEERKQQADSAVLEYAVNSRELMTKYGSAEAYLAHDPDYSEVYFEYCYGFPLSEMYQLYSDCIVPDLADGTLGRVWILPDNNPDYDNTSYLARIEIDFRRPAVSRQGISPLYTGDYDAEYFYTVPTVDASRTLRWLAEHGVEPLHLAGEVKTDNYAYYYSPG